MGNAHLGDHDIGVKFEDHKLSAYGLFDVQVGWCVRKPPISGAAFLEKIETTVKAILLEFLSFKNLHKEADVNQCKIIFQNNPISKTSTYHHGATVTVTLTLPPVIEQAIYPLHIKSLTLTRLYACLTVSLFNGAIQYDAEFSDDNTFNITNTSIIEQQESAPLGSDMTTKSLLQVLQLNKFQECEYNDENPFNPVLKPGKTQYLNTKVFPLQKIQLPNNVVLQNGSLSWKSKFYHSIDGVLTLGNSDHYLIPVTLSFNYGIYSLQILNSIQSLYELDMIHKKLMGSEINEIVMQYMRVHKCVNMEYLNCEVDEKQFKQGKFKVMIKSVNEYIDYQYCVVVEIKEDEVLMSVLFKTKQSCALIK